MITFGITKCSKQVCKVHFLPEDIFKYYEKIIDETEHSLPRQIGN
jgi:hypothetical protein